MNRYFTIRAIILFIFSIFLFSASVTAQTDIGIEFNFANSQVTNDGANSYYEFDITATATASSQFRSAQVYFNYNTDAFGTYIFDNGNIEVTKGELLELEILSNPAYNLILEDNDLSIMSITNEHLLTATDFSSALSTTPIVYVHVKINIQNISETSGITFNTSISQYTDQAFYYPIPGSIDILEMYTPAIFGPGINDPLPVELVSFSASTNKNNILLEWRTETEINNYGFEVQRSENSDFSNWQNIAFVEGYGNCNSPKEYRYVDRNPVGGTRFAYRLKQLDNDGTFEYSEKVEVEFTPAEFALEQNYPNPFNPATNINFSIPQSSKVSLTIYNINGEVVFGIPDKFYEAGNQSIKFDGSSLTSGIYFYRIIAGNFIETKKMLLLK